MVVVSVIELGGGIVGLMVDGIGTGIGSIVGVKNSRIHARLASLRFPRPFTCKLILMPSIVAYHVLTEARNQGPLLCRAMCESPYLTDSVQQFSAV